MLKRATLLACAALLLAASAHAITLEHDIHFAADRVALTQRDGFTLVSVRGGSPETQPGRPDLPVTSERVVLPPGTRVTGVEVVDLASEPLAGAVRIPPAFRIRPEVAPSERTEPDPVVYGAAGFQPESPVSLGYQGFERGVSVAYLQVRPVRWDPSSGRLERLRSARVRLTLETASDGDRVPRERIVREWEPDLAGLPAPELGAALTSVTPLGGRTAQPFKPTQIPSLLGSPVEYVIITVDPYVSEFQRLADWKTESGVPAVVRTLSFIRQQYPFGVDDADKIRQFIRDAYSRWGTKWVLLGGDTDEIPTRFAYTTFYGGESIACDLYFSCLDGNWNADGDGLYGEGGTPGDAADLLPEVWVGRAPVTTPAEAQLFVDKSLQYVREPAGDYENTVLFFAEVLFPQDWIYGDPSPSLDGAQIVEEDCLPHIHTNPSIHYARLYQNYADARWEPGSMEETRSKVIDSLDVGYNLANHVGHGYRNVMSVGDANLTNADATNLANGNRLTCTPRTARRTRSTTRASARRSCTRPEAARSPMSVRAASTSRSSAGSIRASSSACCSRTAYRRWASCRPSRRRRTSRSRPRTTSIAGPSSRCSCSVTPS
jgi:hypothetical protein